MCAWPSAKLGRSFMNDHRNFHIFEGILLLCGHISTFAFSPFGTFWCMWRGIGKDGEWRVSRVNGHCPRKWIHCLFSNHDLPRSKNNYEAENLTIMPIIITIWGMKWKECVLCPFGYRFFYSLPSGNRGGVSFFPPCKSAKDFCLGNDWRLPHLVVLLTTPPIASHRSEEVGKESESHVVFPGARTQGMNQWDCQHQATFASFL